MNLVKGNKKGVTLVEMLIAVLLLSLVFMAVSALYVASQRFYFVSSDKAILGYELQYVVQHISNNAMKGIGDAISSGAEAIDVPDAETLDIRINNNDPVTGANYQDVVTYSYYKDGDELKFDNGSSEIDSLAQKVTITEVNFSKNGNLLEGRITAAYKTQSMTLYFACYPRMASFY